MTIGEIVFVPENSLQGQEISGHILWDREKKIILGIELPDGIRVKELYNVEKKGYSVDGQIITINKFEVNGYLGFTLLTSIYKESKIRNEIKFILESGTEKNVIKKTIELFRPDINLIKTPCQINIKVDENNKLSLDNRLLIENLGEGTGVINLEIDKKSELDKIDPAGIQEFSRKFWESANKQFESLKNQYQEYAELIDNFSQLNSGITQFDKHGMNKIKIIFKKLNRACEENNSFLEDFAGIIVSSYLKNISILTEVESFIAYLQSIHLGKMMLFDPVKVLKITTKTKILKAKLGITDLAYNKYDPIEFQEIQITANKECELPIHQLLSFIKKEKET